MYRLNAVNSRRKRRLLWPILIVFLIGVVVAIGFVAYKAPEAIKVKTPATKDQPITLNVKAKSAIVVDLTTGQVLGEKNPDKQAAIASESKLLVAYGVLKAVQDHKINWTDQVTIPASADLSSQDSNAISHLNMKAGDKVSVHDLYWSMFTNSANDAALSLTAFLTPSGSTSQDTLEGWAKDLNLTDSAWYNGAGLKNGDALGSQISSESSSAANHASASQVAQIANQVLAMDPSLKTVTSSATITYTKNKTTKVTDTSGFGQQFANIVKGLNNPNGLQLLGLKTGSTPEAGACFTGYVVDKNGHEFLTVVNDAADYTDNKVRFQTTLDMVDQVLAKEQAHTFNAGDQVSGQKTLAIKGDKAKAAVEIANTKTYWTKTNKKIQVKTIGELKEKPAADSLATLAYGQVNLKGKFLPNSTSHQKDLPLTLLHSSDQTAQSTSSQSSAK